MGVGLTVQSTHLSLGRRAQLSPQCRITENPGQLRSGFDLSRIASSVSGLGLVKALLPRRGAKLAIEQHGGMVVTRLELLPPAIGEDVG